MPQLRAHVGIDPGQTGAVAVIWPTVDTAGIRNVDLFDTPIFTGPQGKKQFDEDSMVKLLEAVRSRDVSVHVTIEKVNAMPKQGVASTFNFGMGYGVWLGIIAALRLQSQRVHPARWKKVVLADSAKVDQAVVAHAARLYPGISDQLRGPKGGLKIGRADALLLAHYGTLAA